MLWYAEIKHSDWLKIVTALGRAIRVLYFSIVYLRYSKICLCQRLLVLFTLQTKSIEVGQWLWLS